MIATVIVFVFNFLVFNIHPTQIIENSVTKNEMQVSVLINQNIWDKFDSKDLLLGILTASAAILAISFTIIQLLVSNFDEKYGGYAKSFLNVKPNTPFLAMILVITSSSIMLFTQSLNELLALILTLAVMEGFIFSLILYARNYYDLFRLMNPLSFIDEIGDTVTQNMRGENNE